MNGFYVLIGYFVIALIVFAVLDYFAVKKIIPIIVIEVEGLVFISMFWIFFLVALIIVTPFYIIDKLVKRLIKRKK